ncbi:MAG: methylenetetrahydrofolate reductase C-terminal domain-containing protein [Verrucomicrobia bacterium]|nr:methylenetetrahydrofolate reductase C-terminal domain-containing protein [Verrucomicrobiota bacterium]
MIAPKDGRPFSQMLGGGGFYYGAELVTTRGFVPPEQPNRIVEFSEQLCNDARIGWVSLTDNPGGNTMLPPDWLARILGGKKTAIVLHLTCKNHNRSALESIAWKYAAEGIENIVAMTGDYPRSGYGGNASPVFDLDSVSLVAMLHAMNQGIQTPGKKGEAASLPKTNFYIGCVVSPFKRHERELMPQYYKLLRKVASGAQYVYTQLGYDMRKFHEVKLLLAANGTPLPVIGNAYLLNKIVAGLFHRRQIPGCVVSDRLLELSEKYAAGPDKGRGFFQELAAKQLAVFKGLGFGGGYLSGMSKAETFFKIIDLAESYGENDWRAFAKEVQFPQKDEFYLYEQDPETGLGDPRRINQEYRRSLQQPTKSKHVTLTYRLSRFIHDAIFTPGKPAFNLLRKIYERWDKKPGMFAHAAHALERMSKFVSFGCRDCGDCSLPDCGYLCPLFSCSKGSRNGPCGGSIDGMCELNDKECIWARAYERLKYDKEAEAMLKRPAVFYHAELKGTSSWANTFLGRDHHSDNNHSEAATEKTPQKGP